MSCRLNLQILRAAGTIAASVFLFGSTAQAGNIITFGANTNKCGGAVICSADGTTGYYNDGTGVAFNLSAINDWFQIDLGGKNLLSGQSIPEPDKGAGSFLVTNDTGAAISSFLLTLSDDFTSSTPSVHACTGQQKGTICNNFTAHGGSGSFTYDTELSGADWDHCTQGTVTGQACTGKAGGVAADFAPNSVTYTWTAEFGKSIPAGGMFTISFSGWNNDSVAFTPSICDSISGNLVQNCGFETGDFTDWSGVAFGEPNISKDANSGHYSAEVYVPQSLDGEDLTQSFNTIAKGNYTATFYVKSVVWNGTMQNFTVQVRSGANTLGSWGLPSNGFSNWTKQSFQFTGDGETDTLHITAGTGGISTMDVLIDDIVVTQQ